MRVREVKKILNVSQRTLRNYIHQGLLNPIKINAHHYEYNEDEVYKIINENKPRTAEELHKQLSDLREKLASKLSNDDNESLLRAECFISNIIKGKDNIVDINEVWHDETEKPDGGKLVLLDTCDGYIVRTLASANDEKWRCLAGNEIWASFVYIHDTKRWAYLDDLLPKGDE